jgi:hypothetical protein
MIPWDCDHGTVTRFALCEKPGDCCGDASPIQRIVLCAYPTGIPTAYLPHPVEVRGVLRIEEQKRDGFMSIPFRLTASAVTLIAREPVNELSANAHDHE